VWKHPSLHHHSWLEIVRPQRIFRITSSSSSPWDSWRLMVAKFTAISRCWATWHGKIHNIQALPSILCGNWAEDRFHAYLPKCHPAGKLQ
jgi:hypothetical protein